MGEKNVNLTDLFQMKTSLISSGVGWELCVLWALLRQRQWHREPGRSLRLPAAPWVYSSAGKAPVPGSPAPWAGICVSLKIAKKNPAWLGEMLVLLLRRTATRQLTKVLGFCPQTRNNLGFSSNSNLSQCFWPGFSMECFSCAPAQPHIPQHSLQVKLP